MCGIFGCVGRDISPGLLIEGIRRLEYRGYDSWGIALAAPGCLSRFRRVGRISTAGNGTAGNGTAGNGKAPAFSMNPSRSWMAGIAHTRWATHGAPSEVNAHPHADCSGAIAVIHNGIVENHDALRKSLAGKGHTFRSETDTEVIPHLVEELLKTGADFETAFLEACRLLVGTFGLAVMNVSEPGRIYVARRGSPVVVGLGKEKALVASDPAPLIAHTRDVVYLSDGEAAILRPDGFETRTLDGAPVSKQAERVSFSLPDIERGGFPHFMLKEIFDQPRAIREALMGRIVRGEGTVRLGGLDEQTLQKVRRCHIVACGTSWHAALIGRLMLEQLARVPTQVSMGAEFRYALPVVEPGTLVIAVSQSGETADTLAAVREARLQGADVMGICNAVGSTIARECGKGIYIHAGPEIGVASTKAFTCQLVVLALLAVLLGRRRGMSLAAGLGCLDSLERLPDQVSELLASSSEAQQVAEWLSRSRSVLYAGRLYEYPAALEGALKLKEISYIHAEGLQAAELKHGPIALIDEDVPTILIAAQAAVRDKMLGNAHEVRARGGRIVAIARAGDDDVARLAEHTFFIPPAPDPLVPILGAIPLQLLAYAAGVSRGCDVDTPRNLAKSVTVE